MPTSTLRDPQAQAIHRRSQSMRILSSLIVSEGASIPGNCKNLKPQFHTRGATMADLETSLPNPIENEKGTREDATTEMISSLGIAGVDMDAKTLKLTGKSVREVVDDGGCSCIVLSLPQKGLVG